MNQDVLHMVEPLTKEFEGLKDLREDGKVYPYLDPVGLLTIGWGHLVRQEERSKMGAGLTMAETRDLLRADLRRAYKGMLNYCPRLSLESPECQAAILDWVFNLGAGRLRASTLKRVINRSGPISWPAVTEQLIRWVRGGGRVLPGLVRRREAEIDLIERRVR